MIEVEGAIPMLFVADIAAACSWCERVRGLTTTFRRDGYAGLALGGAHIHLARWLACRCWSFFPGKNRLLEINFI
jgi:hypothetical protein